MSKIQDLCYFIVNYKQIQKSKEELRGKFIEAVRNNDVTIIEDNFDHPQYLYALHECCWLAVSSGNYDMLEFLLVRGVNDPIIINQIFINACVNKKANLVYQIISDKYIFNPLISDKLCTCRLSYFDHFDKQNHFYYYARKWYTRTTIVSQDNIYQYDALFTGNPLEKCRNKCICLNTGLYYAYKEQHYELAKQIINSDMCNVYVINDIFRDARQRTNVDMLNFLLNYCLHKLNLSLILRELYVDETTNIDTELIKQIENFIG